jgi:3-(3-hydroxy-phenyl)propionate hydroxylase
MQAGLRRVTGDAQAELSDAIWLTRGRLQHGVASSFQAGRVLLAGDAGHMTIPVYGQGMNTGMQDAFNLAWKLERTLISNVPGLLDSYSEERHAVRAALNAEQGTILQRAAYPNRLQRLLMPIVGPIAVKMGAGRHLRDRSAQLTIAYRQSSLSHRQGRHPGVGAGDRAPDAIVVRADDFETTTLFSEIYAGGWTLLCFGADATTKESRVCCGVCSQIEDEFQGIRSLYVAAAITPVGATRHAILDYELYAHKAYGVGSRPSFFLIRPDGYIGFSCHGIHIDALRAYCARWLTAR